MIRSISLRIMTLKESKNFFTGLTFLPGNKIIPIPKNKAKKMTCNMFRLLEAARKILEGTTSTKACKGPDSCCLAAAACLAWVSVA